MQSRSKPSSPGPGVGRATCARLSRAPPPGRGRPAPRPLGPRPGGRSLPRRLPAGPAPRPPSAALALPAASPGPPVCLFQSGRGAALGGSGRATGEVPPRRPEGTGEASGPPRRWRRGAPLFPFQSAGFTSLPFRFDPLVSQEEEARLSAFCSRTRTLRGHASPCRQGRPPAGGAGRPHSAARLSPPGDAWEGPGRSLQTAAPLAGGHVHLLGEGRSVPVPSVSRSIPALGPAAARRDRECRFRREAAGGACRKPPGPLPCQSRLPGGWRRAGEGEGVDNQVATCLACLGAFIYSPCLPPALMNSRPFRNSRLVIAKPTGSKSWGNLENASI